MKQSKVFVETYDTSNFGLSFQNPHLKKSQLIFFAEDNESDTGPDLIWSDPIIRRNPIGIRVAESLTDPTVKS
jgi:hypothetical protein